MSASYIAASFVKQHEGCRLEAYADSAGVATIGWGSTGPDIHLGLVWTQAQADARLASDLYKTEMAVRGLIHVHLGDNALAALISFAYNGGITAFKNSTLLLMVNGEQMLTGAKEFLRWDHSGGTELKGLLRRRLAEATLFLADE